MEQGRTEPTLWLADDGERYVVKSTRVGQTTLVHEWIAAHLARSLDLPVPPCTFVYFEPAGLRYAANPEARYLADRPGFGSRYVEPNTQYSPDLRALISGQTRRRVLWFDWWIQNGDRIDGNPNMLWRPDDSTIHLIDHNNSFLPDDEVADFFDHHPFRADRALSDPLERASLGDDFERTMGGLAAAWTRLPDEWTESCTTTLDRVDSILGRCRHNAFWDHP